MKQVSFFEPHRHIENIESHKRQAYVFAYVPYVLCGSTDTNINYHGTA